MAINSTESVTSPYATPVARVVSVRDPGSLARQIPALAVPGVAVTIGAVATSPLLYNPAGLLRSLGKLDATEALPSGANSTAGSAGLQGNLETVLGLNSESGFLGTSNPLGSLANLSADSRAALNTVLADGQGNDQALQELLAQTLNTSNSGMDRARSAAGVVDAAGVLRSGSSDQSIKALDALRGSNLGLAATAIDAGRSSSGGASGTSLLQSPAGDATSQGFNRSMAAKLEAAVAEIDTARPRRRSQAGTGANDLLLSGVALLTTATDVAAIDAEPALLADQLSSGSTLQADALARLALRTPRRTDEASPTVTTDLEVAIEEPAATAQASRAVPTARTAPEDQTDRTISSAVDSTPPESRPVPAGPPATATTTREPRYAELAASMNMGAAVYRFQTSVATGVPAGEVDPLRTVLQIRSTPAVNKVT